MSATISIKSVLSILLCLPFGHSAFALGLESRLEDSFGINKPYKRAVTDSRLFQRSNCGPEDVICLPEGFDLVFFSTYLADHFACCPQGSICCLGGCAPANTVCCGGGSPGKHCNPGFFCDSTSTEEAALHQKMLCGTRRERAVWDLYCTHGEQLIFGLRYSNWCPAFLSAPIFSPGNKIRFLMQAITNASITFYRLFSQ